MKTHLIMASVVLMLSLVSCQSATPSPTLVPTPAGQMETQVAGTIYANQTATAEVEQAANMTLTAAVPTSTNTPSVAPTTGIININIAADACWVDSGVKLSTGQVVTITATGTANTWEGKEGSSSGPDGQTGICGDTKCPLLGANYGALIGRLGDGKSFLVGSHLEFTASADGNLFLTVNDWECADNIGSYNLSVTIH